MDHDPPTSTSHIAGIIGMSHPLELFRCSEERNALREKVELLLYE
jgi:hypothetical protein